LPIVASALIIGAVWAQSLDAFRVHPAANIATHALAHITATTLYFPTDFTFASRRKFFIHHSRNVFAHPRESK
jgi:hypothetical protein